MDNYLFFKRPAGYDGEEILNVITQVSLFKLSISTLRFLTFVCLVSTGMIVMETFGMLEKITEFFSPSLMAYFFYS
jgi:hypothetical protein